MASLAPAQAVECTQHVNNIEGLMQQLQEQYNVVLKHHAAAPPKPAHTKRGPKSRGTAQNGGGKPPKSKDAVPNGVASAPSTPQSTLEDQSKFGSSAPVSNGGQSGSPTSPMFPAPRPAPESPTLAASLPAAVAVAALPAGDNLERLLTRASLAASRSFWGTTTPTGISHATVAEGATPTMHAGPDAGIRNDGSAAPVPVNTTAATPKAAASQAAHQRPRRNRTNRPKA